MPEWINKEDCLKRGGHYWNNYDSHTPVNEYGICEHPGMRYALGGEPTQKRKCSLCGTSQWLQPAQWMEVK